MNDEKKSLPKNRKTGSKPVQEDLPSSKQKPMGDESDLKKNDKRIAERGEEDNNDSNSVGIIKK